MNDTYRVELQTPNGTEIIFAAVEDMARARHIAVSRSVSKRLRRPNHTLVIYRNGKVLRGGRYALDDMAYKQWLEANADRGEPFYCAKGVHPPRK